jgi:FtsP/CotA-like multicopper oxidase with cupredoxin domain
VTTTQRILAAAGTLVVLVIAFVVLSPGGSDKKTPTTTVAATAPSGTTSTTGGAVQGEPAPPAPSYTTITVRGGQPVGGIKKITINKGDTARIEITSPDTTSEIHLHGYDLKRNLKAGGSVRYTFVAKTDGIYVIELEGTGTQIGSLVVEP